MADEGSAAAGSGSPLIDLNVEHPISPEVDAKIQEIIAHPQWGPIYKRDAQNSLTPTEKKLLVKFVEEVNITSLVNLQNELTGLINTIQGLHKKTNKVKDIRILTLTSEKENIKEVTTEEEGNNIISLASKITFIIQMALTFKILKSPVDDILTSPSTNAVTNSKERLENEQLLQYYRQKGIQNVGQDKHQWSEMFQREVRPISRTHTEIPKNTKFNLRERLIIAAQGFRNTAHFLNTLQKEQNKRNQVFNLQQKLLPKSKKLLTFAQQSYLAKKVLKEKRNETRKAKKALKEKRKGGKHTRKQQ